MTRNFLARCTIGLILATTLVGCSSNGKRAVPTVSKAAVASGAKGDDVVVELTLYSNDGDTLVSARVASAVAERAVLVADGTHDGKVGHVGHLDPGGSLGPDHEAAKIRIPAENAITLGLGTEHVALVNLAKTLEVGTKVDVTLTFKESGDVTTALTVR